MARFHLKRIGLHWGWQLKEGDTVLAAAGQSYPTKGEALDSIGAMRTSDWDADVYVETSVPESRWRRLNPDGSIGEPVGDDPPETAGDEGETGPPEVQA